MPQIEQPNTQAYPSGNTRYLDIINVSSIIRDIIYFNTSIIF